MEYNSDTKNKIASDDEIDLKELISVIWVSKRLVFIITAIFVFGSILYAFSLTNLYKSEAILNVAGQTSNNNSLSGLSGLASMAGINLPSNTEDKSILALEIVQSRAFLKHLTSFENIIPSLMAVKKYDGQSGKLLFDEEIYNSENREWVFNSSTNKGSAPSYLEVYDTYLDQITVSRDNSTNLITMSYQHESPIFAKSFLDLIISETNEILRNKDLRESSDAIEFLMSEIPKSSLVSMKDAINQLVMSKLEMQMMARINTEYVLKIIEPPFVPEKKSKPNRRFILILGALIGGLLSSLWVLIRHYSLGEIK